MRKGIPVKGKFALVLSILLIGYGGYDLTKVCLAKAYGVETTGRVVDFHYTSDGDQTRRPIINFYSEEQSRSYDFKHWVRSKTRVEIGHEVTVLYLPEHPKESAIVELGYWNYYTGIIGLLMGLMALRQSRPSKKKSKKQGRRPGEIPIDDRRIS